MQPIVPINLKMKINARTDSENRKPLLFGHPVQRLKILVMAVNLRVK